MAQTYTDIQPSDLISNSLSMLMGNFETVMSNSRGTAFPTTGLINGQWCFRADQNKLYLLMDKDTLDWQLFYDLNDPHVSLSLLTAQLATKQNVIGAGSALQNVVNSLLAANRAVVTDANGRLVDASVTAAEVGALAGVNQNIQVQFGAKQNKITISTAMPSGGVDGDIWLQVMP